MSEAARWALPAVEGRLVQRRRERPTAAELDDLARAARDEGHAKGLHDGLAAAAADIRRRTEELDQRVARLDALLSALARPIEQLESEVEHRLASLALTVARHIVRRELRIDPAQVIGILREAVALLPAAARDVRVHLHPEDAKLVAEKLAAPSTERAWIVVEDPVMARGGCRISAQHSRIDAGLDSRINAAIASVLGEDRGA